MTVIRPETPGDPDGPRLKTFVMLDLSNPDWFGEDGLSEVASCLRNLAWVDNEGRSHRARVARALADQIDEQITGTTDEKYDPPFNDPYGY